MLRALLIIVVLVFGFIAIEVVVNAVDEPLHAVLPDAAVPEEPTRDNGYVWMLGVPSRDDDVYRAGVAELERLRKRAPVQPGSSGGPSAPTAWCSSDDRARCLAVATALGSGRATAIVNGAAYRERARRISEAPRFDELYAIPDVRAEIPNFSPEIAEARLALLDAADLMLGGRVDDGLERFLASVAAHRRALQGSRTLIGKMVARSNVERDALFAIELARSTLLAPMQREQLASALVPLTDDEATLVPALDSEARYQAASALQRPFDLVDSGADGAPGPDDRERRAEAIGRYFYRPNATANAMADHIAAQRGLATSPLTELDARIVDVRETTLKARGPSVDWFVNPVGKWMLRVPPDFVTYIARVDDTRALVALAGAMAGRGDAVDPYTAKPFVRAADGRFEFHPRSQVVAKLGIEGVDMRSDAALN